MAESKSVLAESFCRPFLSMVVYNPATPEDAERIKSLRA